ncbi:hypothetical protein VP1G_05758 [Cytospora mali]|uniref:Metaxin-1 n=1 Tax=Cytospora mali TaxID=578113 RepID=A0A194V3F9_CYTMA|nr:hypothetical protein VP1G_05758 [Valsa mali var. pyri (nom. inval.)]
MTDKTASSNSGPSPEAGSSKGTSRGSWVPTIPAPLQRLFDAVPLVTYPPNELPYRSPGATDLPTLHVFISEEDAARGAPSFNPSCLKWQTFLRIAGVQFHLRPSTNHASPTGALPFLQPPIPSISTTSSTTTTTTTTTPSTPNHQRLEPRTLLPIPSSRLEAYAAQHGALPPPTLTPEAPTPQLQSQARRRQAYQSLLDGPIRNAWLYTLYLSPANEHVLRRWYVDPVSRSGAVQDTILRQLRRAVRTEIARSSETTRPAAGCWWALSGDIGDVLAWAVGGSTVVEPAKVYAEAARAFEALETLLYREGETEAGDGAGGAAARWFFDAPHPTVFDAAVFSYVYLILHGDGDGGKQPWVDDTLRQILVGKCRRLVGHTQRVLDEYWTDQVGQGWVELH